MCFESFQPPQATNMTGQTKCAFGYSRKHFSSQIISRNSVAHVQIGYKFVIKGIYSWALVGVSAASQIKGCALWLACL